MMDRIGFADRIRKGRKLQLPHASLTGLILRCCFDVSNELGFGFLEAVYKNALFLSLRENGVLVETEKVFEVYFKEQKVGLYKADLIAQGTVLIELKCCKSLLPEHQAQVINYLKAAHLPVGLLINFGSPQLEYKRLRHPSLYPVGEADPVHPVN